MARIAVDVVLLPSKGIADKAVAANKLLLQQEPDRIVLAGNIKDGGKATLPHVSLAMGCIAADCIVETTAVLREIAHNCPLESLYITDVTSTVNSTGEDISYFMIKKTAALMKLHEEVMRKFKPCFSYDVSAEMLLSETAISVTTLLWIKNYPANSSFDKFSPHITLGYGQIDKESSFYQNFGPLPVKFSASQLALCRLGNHCTCKKILAGVEM